MEQLILINKKNNKFIISSEYTRNIKEIIFFKSSTGERILQFQYRGAKFKVSRINNLYNEETTSEEEAKAIILNNEPIRKIKENLKEKNNFYIAKKDKYGDYDITLYVNIEEEKISIEENGEESEEFGSGYFHIYKKYIFKNFFIQFKNFTHLFFKKESIEKMSYNEFKRLNIESIEEKTKKAEKNKSLFNNQKVQENLSRLLKKLKELEKQEISHIGYTYIDAESEAKGIKIFDRVFRTEENIQRSENLNYLKDIIYNEKKLVELFKKFNIDINKVTFKD